MAGFQTIEPFVRSQGWSLWGERSRRVQGVRSSRMVSAASRAGPDPAAPDPEKDARREMIELRRQDDEMRQRRDLERELGRRRARAAMSVGGIESASLRALTDDLSDDTDRAINRIAGRDSVQFAALRESAQRQRRMDTVPERIFNKDRDVL